jgi:hypothetical protein
MKNDPHTHSTSSLLVLVRWICMRNCVRIGLYHNAIKTLMKKCVMLVQGPQRDGFVLKLHHGAKSWQLT